MKNQISNGMFMALIINMVYSKAIGLTQGIMAREVGNDIWISTIFSAVQGCAVILMTILVVRRAPHLDFMGLTEKMLGKWAGKIIALILFIFFAGAYSSVMITYVYHLMDYFLPEVPAYLFILVAFLIGGFGVFSGIEVISRLALIGVFFITALNLLLLTGSLRNLTSEDYCQYWNREFGLPSGQAGKMIPIGQ